MKQTLVVKLLIYLSLRSGLTPSVTAHVMLVKMAAAAKVPPQNTCTPTLNFRLPSIAPTTGLPSETPRARQESFMTILPPTIRIWDVMEATAGFSSETKAPENAPYSMDRMMMPARLPFMAIHIKSKTAEMVVVTARLVDCPIDLPTLVVPFCPRPNPL